MQISAAESAVLQRSGDTTNASSAYHATGHPFSKSRIVAAGRTRVCAHPSSVSMRKIRVVFSIGAMHGGGSERQIVTILRHLDRDRFDPHLYLIYRAGPLLSEVPCDVPISTFEERVRTTRYSLPGQTHRRRVQDLACFMRETEADVSYDRTFLMTLIAADAAQRTGIPNVSTIVTNPETGFAPVAGRFASFKRRILKRLYRRSAGVVAVSQGVADAAARFYSVPRDKITVLANGVDVAAIEETARFASVLDEWWNRRQDDGPMLVTAGRLDERKGFQLLIDAVSRLRQRESLRNIRLAILGDGPYRAELQHRIDSLSLQDHVRLMGFRGDAAAWYRAADVFVLPSLVEGMPNVLLEAMAVGTPVVAADCPSGPAAVLQNGRLGELVTVNDVQALVEGISRVAMNPEDAANKTALALESVRTEQSAVASVRKLEELLSDRVRLC